jgi:tetratricopeptide (TPR) repeat protein
MSQGFARPQHQQQQQQQNGQDFQSLVLFCNRDGMDSLHKGQLKAAFDQFKYAEAILIANQAEGDNTSLLAVTCNNLGCYYQKTGKLHGALSYLRRALKMEVDLDTDEVTLAGTHLNICKILSKLEKHDKAVQHAMCALELIKRRVENAATQDLSQDDYSVLAISYHNVALERNFLQEYEKAAEAFQEGYQVAKRCLGQDHPLSVTLGQKCDAALKKTAKAARMPGAFQASTPQSLAADIELPHSIRMASPLTMLPSIAGAQPRDLAPQTEEQKWAAFAQTTLTGASPLPAGTSPSPALQESQVGQPVAQPPAEAFRDIPFRTASLKSPFLGKSPLGKAIDENADVLMDIIDADSANHVVTSSRTAPHDFRPNRVIKGATRTARVVRRTGIHRSTKHRDHMIAGRCQLGTTSDLKDTYKRKAAAERIQRVWRSWYRYCQENHDWMTTTWVAATMIQSAWRSYHVRRRKLDMAAQRIQRHMRGCLVRRILQKHRAAVTIQRHTIGMLTRMQLRRLQMAATKIESLARGAASRRVVGKKRKHLNATALTIQCAVRQSFARWIVGARRRLLQAHQARNMAATDIQRLFRGVKGRQRARAFRDKYLQDLRNYDAATKLQAMARRDRAIKRVDRIRGEQLTRMTHAATYMRKMWKGCKARKRYKQLLGQFAAHEAHVKTIQRFTRGFLVRLRMWREAIRAEEELWAAMEIQRIYKGYRGRVRWEDKLEDVWRRELSAYVIQRNMRGWLDRTRVGRMRRRIARSQFERARGRFRAAQRIQSLVRGVLSRKITGERRRRKLFAIVMTQRIWRGHQLRNRLWKQVIQMRATKIQALVRGFLTRNRRFRLTGIAICIQRSWRIWRKRPQAERQRAFDARQLRKDKAALIQEKVRKRQENKAVQNIQQQS